MIKNHWLHATTYLAAALSSLGQLHHSLRTYLFLHEHHLGCAHTFLQTNTAQKIVNAMILALAKLRSEKSEITAQSHKRRNGPGLLFIQPRAHSSRPASSSAQPI